MRYNRIKEYNSLVKVIDSRYNVWRILKKEDSEVDKKIIKTVLKEYKYLLKVIGENDGTN